MRRYLLPLMALFLLCNLVACSKTEMQQSTNALETGNLGAIINDHPTLAIPALPSKENYAIVFNNMDGFWKHAGTARVQNVDIDTFVPQTEDSKKWKQRIEVTHVKTSKSMTAQKYYQQVVHGGLDNLCPYSTPKVKVLHNASNDIIYEYQVLNCGKKPNQAVIGRVIRTPNSINTISYTGMTDRLDDQSRQYMLEIVKGARVE
ncbi:MAG: hypothetical protein KAT71_00705 [Gammaproteobacteria bacterium]|nr:hypothetical protein [Gammaproteobacteria bacterium]